MLLLRQFAITARSVYVVLPNAATPRGSSHRVANLANHDGGTARGRRILERAATKSYDSIKRRDRTVAGLREAGASAKTIALAARADIATNDSQPRQPLPATAP